MATTGVSTPVSDLSEPLTPPEGLTAIQSKASVEAERDSSSLPQSLSTLNAVPLPTSSTSSKKSPAKNASTTTTSTRRKNRPRKPSNSSTSNEEHCPVCQKLDARQRKQRAKVGTTWVECDQCETWYHWSCVAPSPSDSPDSLDKWYCDGCLQSSLSTSQPLTISYKLSSTLSDPKSDSVHPVDSSTSSASSRRKSNRATRTQVDYSNLNAHLPASIDRWSHVISARTASGQIKEDDLERKLAKDLTMEWVYGEEGMKEPFVVEEPEGLGMSMPKRDITVGEIAELIGPETPLEVIDCASQSSLSNWTLGQWASYYSSPDRDKVRNVISLEVSETRLGKMVVAPELVRRLDWVDNVWPQEMKTPGNYPRVQKYCLMSVKQCWTDWHIDFAGSSVFYHILKGGKTFYFIRPTPANLAAYERWSGSTERQEQEWLGDSCDEVLKLELKEGNTAFLPTGWIHAVYTPADSIVIGGNFLHSLNIPTQLRIYEIELATKVPKKFRYPHFVKLLWLVANHYQAQLNGLKLLPTSADPLPATLSRRVLEGLFVLSTFLIEQTTRFNRSPTVSAERRRIARENVPWKQVGDPVVLSRELRKNVLRAQGKELDAECFKPHVTTVDEDKVVESKGIASANGGAIKRKASEGPIGSNKSAKIKSASTTSPPPANLANQGEIISRQAIPIPPSTRSEPRSDPQHPERGNRPAEVRENRNTQTVVRRWEDKGDTFVETRTVHTIIERVKWNNGAKEEETKPTIANGTSSYVPYVVPEGQHLSAPNTTAPAYPPLPHHFAPPTVPFGSHPHQFYPHPHYSIPPTNGVPFTPFPPPHQARPPHMISNGGYVPYPHHTSVPPPSNAFLPPSQPTILHSSTTSPTHASSPVPLHPSSSKSSISSILNSTS